MKPIKVKTPEELAASAAREADRQKRIREERELAIARGKLFGLPSEQKAEAKAQAARAASDAIKNEAEAARVAENANSIFAFCGLPPAGSPLSHEQSDLTLLDPKDRRDLRVLCRTSYGYQSRHLLRAAGQSPRMVGFSAGGRNHRVSRHALDEVHLAETQGKANSSVFDWLREKVASGEMVITPWGADDDERVARAERAALNTFGAGNMGVYR